MPLYTHTYKEASQQHATSGEFELYSSRTFKRLIFTPNVGHRHKHGDVDRHVHCRGSGRRRRPYSHRSPNSRNQGAHRQKYKAIQLILEEGLIRLTCLHARVAIDVMVVAQSGSTFLALKVLLKRRGLTHRGGGYCKVVLR